MKRIFVAVNLPKEIKKELAKKQEDIKINFETDPVKWVVRDNLHITLAFLGSIDDDLIPKVVDELKNLKSVPFNFYLDDIKYIPNRREAKMIWSTGVSKQLEYLKKEIDEILTSIDGLSYTFEGYDFSPHVTLGRIKKIKFRNQPLEEIPLLEDEFVDLSFKVETVDLMESKLKRPGPEYKKIKSIILS